MIQTKGFYGFEKLVWYMCLLPFRYETISDLMTLQDQIDSFQKLVFSHFRHGLNNECRISSLVPLVQESYGIYKFITSMLRAMHTSKCCGMPVLDAGQ
jgi:hypothetical protein